MSLISLFDFLNRMRETNGQKKQIVQNNPNLSSIDVEKCVMLFIVCYVKSGRNSIRYPSLQSSQVV